MSKITDGVVYSFSAFLSLMLLNLNTKASIKLQSSDEEIFEVDIKIVKEALIIWIMLEDLGLIDEGNDDPVPLQNVVQ